MNSQQTPPIKRTPYSIGQRIQKSSQYPKGFKPVDITDIPRNKPIIIAISGNGAYDDKQANGMAKTVYNLLGIKPQDNYIDIYSIRYGRKEAQAISGANFDYNGDITGEEITELAENIILPRAVNELGEKLPLVELCRNMRQLNFVTFCKGQEILLNLLHKSAKYMITQLNYTPNEIETAMKQILNVCYSPYSVIWPYNTNINFKSLSDGSVNGIGYIDEFTDGHFEDVEVTDLNITTDGVKVDGNTVNVFASNFAGYKKLYDQQKTKIVEHDISSLSRDENWHSLNSEFADMYSRCFAMALSAGVTNSIQNQHADEFIPLPSAEDFSYIIKSVLEEKRSQDLFTENNEYRQKIIDMDKPK